MANEWIPAHLARRRGGYPLDAAGWRPPWGPFLLLFFVLAACMVFLFWSKLGLPMWR